MSFGQPLWFWAFALLPILLAFYVRHERRRVRALGEHREVGPSDS